MEWRFGNIFNSADEMAQIMEYSNIKLFKLEHMTSPKPQEDLMTVNYYKTWVSSSDEVGVSSFSAICLLTAKYMADVLGKDKVILLDLIFILMILIIKNAFHFYTIPLKDIWIN